MQTGISKSERFCNLREIGWQERAEFAFVGGICATLQVLGLGVWEEITTWNVEKDDRRGVWAHGGGAHL